MKPRPVSRKFLAFSAAIAAMLAAHSAQAVGAWDGDTTQYWNNSNNWDSLPTSGTITALTFNVAGTAVPNQTNNDITGTFQLNSMAFGANMTVSGNKIEFAGTTPGITIGTGVTALVFNNDINFAASTKISSTSTATPTTVTFNGLLSGSTLTYLNATATPVLAFRFAGNASNSMNGFTIGASGTNDLGKCSITIAMNDPFGGVAGSPTALSFVRGTTLAMTGEGSTVLAPRIINSSISSMRGNMTVDGTSMDFRGSFSTNDTTTTRTITNNMTGGQTLTLASGTGSTFSISGPIIIAGTADSITAIPGVVTGSNTLQKTATNTLRLTGLNTFTNKAYVNVGTLEFNTVENIGSATANALGKPSTGNETIQLGGTTNAGTLKYIGTAGGGHSTDRPLNLAGTTGGGTLDASGTGTIGFLGGVTASGVGAKNLTLTGTNTGNNTLGGAIVDSSSGATSLIKSGLGTWALTGTNAYTGATTVSAGTLLLDFSTATAPASNIINSGNSLVMGGGTLNLKGKGGSTTDSQSVVMTNTASTGLSNIVVNNNNSSGSTTLALSATGLGTRGTADTLNIDLSQNVGGGNLITTTASAATLGWATVKDATGTGFGQYTGTGLVRLTGQTTLATNSDASGTDFILTGAGATLTHDGGNWSANSLTLDTSGGTATLDIGTGITTLTNLGVLLTGSNNATIQNGQLGAAASDVIVHTMGAGTLTLSSNTTISSGTGSLTKSGPGTLIVSSANTYTGSTFVNQGTLQLNHANAVHNSTVTMGATSGTLTFNSGITTFNIGGLSGSGPLALTDTAASAVTLNVGNNNTNTTYSGILSGTGGALTKSGTGTLALTGANTYTGTTTMLAGNLTIGNSTTGGLGATPLTFNGTSTFNVQEIASSSQNLGALTFSAGQGTVTSTAAGATSAATLTFASMATRTAGATGNFSLVTNTTSTGGTPNRIVLTSTTNVPLSSSGSNNPGIFFNLNGGDGYARYDGAGYFRAVSYGVGADSNAPAAIGAGTTGMGINDATKDVSITGNITNQGTAAINTLKVGGSLTQTAGTTLSVNGLFHYIAGASNKTISGGNIQVTGSTGGELVIASSSPSTGYLWITSLIQDNGGVTALPKSGNGPLRLDASNTYTGVTTINEGILRVNSGSFANGGLASAIGAASAAASNLVINGGTLQYLTGSANQSTDRLFTIGTGGATLDASGTGSLNIGSAGGNIAFSSSTNPASLTLTGTGSGATGSGTLTAVLGDSGTGANITSLTKTSTGTWILAGANTHSGVTTITGGSLQLGNNLALQNSIFDPSGAGSLTFSSGVNTPTIGGLSSGTNLTLASNVTGLTLNPGSGVTATYSGVLGSATAGMILTKTGAGKQILSGTNTYSGATTVHAGTLALGSVGSIANSTTLVVGDAGSSGAVLDVSAKGGGFTIGATQTLKGIGTVNVGSGKTLTVSGTHAPGNSAGLQAVTGNLNYAAGSIFEWELASNITTGPGTNFDAVSVSGNLTLDETPTSGAVFKVVLGVNFNPADTFWLTSKSWNVFTVAGTDTTAFKNFQLFNAGASTTSIDYSNYGNFNYSFGSGTGTLNWTAVPEPTSALAGLLLGAGLLRCRK